MNSRHLSAFSYITVAIDDGVVRRGILALLLSALLQAPRVSALAEDDVVTLLRTGHAEWLDRVSFRSSYTRTIGSASAVEAALSEDIALVGSPRAASGMFHKEGRLQRISIDYGGATVTGAIDSHGNSIALPKQKLDSEGLPEIQGDGKLLIKDSTVDEIFDLNYSLTYHPRWRNAYDDALFTDLRTRVGDAPPCVNTAMEISPLNPVHGCNSSPFEGQAFIGPDVQHEVEAAGENRVRIITVSRIGTPASNGLEQVSKVTWWMEPPLPVIESIDRRIVSMADNTEVMAMCTRLSQFVECKGGMVARKVVAARDFKGAESVLCEIWVSQDLGTRPEAADDFVIHIEPSTSVTGLKNPPAQGAKRDLTLDLASAETLKIAQEPPMPRTDIAKEDREGPRRKGVWLWGVNGIVLVAIFAYVAGSWLRRGGRAGDRSSGGRDR